MKEEGEVCEGVWFVLRCATLRVSWGFFTLKGINFCILLLDESAAIQYIYTILPSFMFTNAFTLIASRWKSSPPAQPSCYTNCTPRVVCLSFPPPPPPPRDVVPKWCNS